MFGYSLGDFIIDTVCCGGLFYLGRKSGENKVYREVKEQQRDAEIRKLQEEINRLKQGKM